MSARDRHDTDGRETQLRRRAQLHFQLTFAWGVRDAMRYDDMKAKFPVLAESIGSWAANEEFIRNVRALGRGADMRDTLMSVGIR